MSDSVVDSVRHRAREVAREDLDRGKVFIRDAARSGSYLYPLRGIYYFATHKSLWRPFLSRLLPTLGLSVGVASSMFFFTYMPQLTVLVFVNGPLAVFTTALLVLSESSTIVSLISRNFILQDALLDTFDATLVARDSIDLVSSGRQLKPGSDPMQRLGRALKSPFSRFSLNGIVRYVLYLPLNFVPVVGTITFLFLQGRSRGRIIHDRYFQLKGWSSSQRAQWLREHTGAYTGFGTVATILEMVPFASFFFSFTNAVAAALWAADIEKRGACE